MSKSPILNVISEVLQGTTVIRAHKYEKICFDKLYSKFDDYYKAFIFNSGSSNWFGLV